MVQARDTTKLPVTTRTGAAGGRMPPAAPVRPWHWIGLGAILLLSTFLNFFRLNALGYGNSYYATGVRSMLLNWHNFFYVSFDPGGFVTIDKPPLGFWLQTMSAHIFGFNGTSLFLPQALAGICSVAVLFQLVRRTFGPEAGLLAALALASMPISVVTSRNNTIDGLLVLTTLLAAWAVSLAVERGQLRWLLLCAVLIGLGFNIKMLEAYLVVPAFGLVYLLGAPRRWWVRILHLALAFVVLAVISLSWVLAVDLTPASQRPYVGSSGINSELNLALGYNGVQRLLGHTLGGTQPPPPPAARRPPPPRPPVRPAPRVAPGPPSPGETGFPGPLRFFSVQLGGQVSWLLPLALLGILAIAWQGRPRWPLSRQKLALTLWTVWLFTMLVFFSIAAFFHTYYLVMVAPAICALVGAGTVTMWRDYRRSGWWGWLLPIALMITAAVQIYLLAAFPGWSARLTLLLALLCGLTSIVLVVLRLRVRVVPEHDGTALPAAPTFLNGWQRNAVLLRAVLTVGVLALFIAPLVWGTISVVKDGGTSSPLAGPGHQAAPVARTPSAQDIAFGKLLWYLEEYQGNTRFLVATLNTGEATPFILNTEEPVMALGGFSGGDRILTTEQLNELVDNGTVRFFLLPVTLSAHPSDGRYRVTSGISGNNGPLMRWVTEHCVYIPPGQWQGKAHQGDSNSALKLYDCAPF